MNNDNIKFKSSTVAPAGEQSTHKTEETDSYKLSSNEPETPDVGPGNSKYAAGDKSTSDWKQVMGGKSGTSAASAVPNYNILEMIVPFCESVNKSSNVSSAMEKLKNYKRPAPKTLFQLFRSQFSAIDPFKITSLKDDWRAIPDYNTLKQNYEPGVLKDYYTNRLTMIEERIANAEREVDTNENSYIRSEFSDFKAFLLDQKEYVETQVRLLLKDELATA